MLVRDCMSRHVVAVRPLDSVEQAAEQMRRDGLRHLPVLRGALLAGILSDRDLRSVAAGAKRVQDIMTLNPVCIPPDASVDEAACLMEERKISGLPVVENGRVVGMLTASDVLRAFVELSGVAEPTTRIIVRLPGGRRTEDWMRELVHSCRADLKWMHRKGRLAHLRLKTRDVDSVVTALEAAGFEVEAVVASESKQPSAAATVRRGSTPRRERAPSRKRGKQ